MAVLQLIRYPNLLIIAVTQVLIRQCIILPLLRQGGMSLQLSAIQFVMLVLATVLIAAGGYAINDYFDRKMDLVNKPESIIVGKLINPRRAMVYHLTFSIIGVVLGSVVALQIDQFYLSTVFFIVAGLLWFYSTTYKRELLLGNILVALLTAFVPFLVLLFELPLLAREYGVVFMPLTKFLMIWVLGFAAFAFLVNLLREIVKDAEDFEGDQAYGKKTVPIVWGMKFTKWLLLILISIVVFLLFFVWSRYIPDTATLVYFLLVLVLPILYVSFLLIKNDNRNTLHKASNILKFIMLGGLGYMIVVNLIINSMQ